jgi:excisionase family DNA binding protein
VTATDEAVRLYTIAALARSWAVSREYIYEEIRAKRLPAVQLGNGDRNKLRVSAVDAAEWIRQHRAASERAS